jgi:hypothetical protein
MVMTKRVTVRMKDKGAIREMEKLLRLLMAAQIKV